MAIVVDIDGVRKSLCGWAKFIGVSRQAIWAKVRYQGHTPEDAVVEYLKRRGKLDEVGREG